MSFCFFLHFQMKFSHIIISSRVLSVTTTTLVVIGFIVIISLPSPANTQPLAANSRDVPHQRYCSLSLFEAIRAICKGRYNSLSNVYRKSKVYTLRRFPIYNQVYSNCSWKFWQSKSCKSSEAFDTIGWWCQL